MALNPSNNSNLEQLALKGLIIVLIKGNILSNAVLSVNFCKCLYLCEYTLCECCRQLKMQHFMAAKYRETLQYFMCFVSHL